MEKLIVYNKLKIFNQNNWLGKLVNEETYIVGILSLYFVQLGKRGNLYRKKRFKIK